jgi:hypothetical protein
MPRYRRHILKRNIPIGAIDSMITSSSVDGEAGEPPHQRAEVSGSSVPQQSAPGSRDSSGGLRSPAGAHCGSTRLNGERKTDAERFCHAIQSAYQNALEISNAGGLHRSFDVMAARSPV